MNKRILLVDDDPGIRDTVSATLRLEGFDVDVAETGEAALARTADDVFDMLILDVMLPGISGTELCRKLRADGNGVPVIMLTAKDAEVDRVVGLELGADDYVTKPFSSAELASRARAIFRRGELDHAARTTETVRRVGGLELDFIRHQVRVDGSLVQMTPSEFKLLALMAGEPERVFSRRQLMEHLWDSAHTGDQHACDVHVSNIRRKIERDPANPERLLTVRAQGYKLVAV
jgi:two-component system response regulator RegX3